MDLSFPFATAFGLADTREHCIESSQGVYRRLLLEDSLKSTGVLDFSTISVLAKADSDGLDVDEIDPEGTSSANSTSPSLDDSGKDHHFKPDEED